MQKQPAGEPQATTPTPVSQISTATSITDLPTTAVSSTVTVQCTKSLPAVTSSWASEMEKSQVKVGFVYT